VAVEAHSAGDPKQQTQPAGKLIVGCGYLGLRVAEPWLAAGAAVSALTRSSERAAAFTARGISPLIADLADASTLRNLPPAETVLYAVGYDPRSGASRRDIHITGFRALVDALAAAPRRFIFISTTGVYGQNTGEWVDEDSPCLPDSESGQIYLEAEQMLLAHPAGERAVILRLAGIYGPDRVPQQRTLAAGEPVPAAGHLNLIHVDDAVQAVLAAERNAATSRVICISDGAPALRRDYYTELARLWGTSPPNFAATETVPKRSSRGASDKRVSNARMLH
jgi:nucleoside-diphosphate-sugar epimerase